MKARLRKSNNMALKASLKRGQKVAETEVPRHWTCEHPYNSWLWEFTLVKKLEEAGFQHAAGSSCCFGGLREKWYSFFGSSDEIRSRLERPCPGHTGLLTYEVEERSDGSLHSPTSEEAEYPWALCKEYARGLKAQIQKERVPQQVHQEAREGWYLRQLMRSTARLQNEDLGKAMARYLTRWESEMRAGEENASSHRSAALKFDARKLTSGFI